MGRNLAAFVACCLGAVLALSIILPVPARWMGQASLKCVHQVLFSLETRNWASLEGDHFVIKYHPGDKESAQMVLQEAEQLYLPLGKAFDYFPCQKVSIAIYSDRLSLNRVFGWGSEESAMGVYWAGVIRVLSPQDWLGDLSGKARDTVFRKEGPVAHEYIHLLVDYKTRGNYPRWLTEGLAQFGEKCYAGIVAEDNREREMLKVSLAELDKHFDDPEWQDYSYAVSEDIVEFFVDNYGSDRIPALLDALGRGETLDSAFQQVTGQRFSSFLHAYQQGPV
jgi:hypothetical protein